MRQESVNVLFVRADDEVGVHNALHVLVVHAALRQALRERLRTLALHQLVSSQRA